MSDRQPRYRSYLLRLWEVQSGGEWVWRASLEGPRTGERHAFADLPELVAFLEERVGLGPQTSTEEGETV